MRIRILIIFTILLITGMICPGSSIAGSHVSPDWLSSVQGSYNGVLYSTGEYLRAKTIFTLLPGGGLSGEYYFQEAEEKVHGTLFDCSVLAHLKIICNWRDRYGTGELVLTFDESVKNFEGYWSVSGDSQRSLWNGARE